MQALGGLKGAPLPAPTKVFVYEGGTKWKDLGQVGNGSRVLCMASFKGELLQAWIAWVKVKPLNLMEVNGLIAAHLMERTSNVCCLGAGCFMLQPMGIFMSIKVARIEKESALHRLILIRFIRCRCLMVKFIWVLGHRGMC